MRAKYPPLAYYSIALFQITMISVSAWKLGASAIRTGSEEHRKLAVTGALLIMPWVFFSLLPGFGPPWQSTAAENRLRYLVLLINAIAVAGGLVVLRDALSQAGERLHSALGFAAIVLASPLYLVWASILLNVYVARERSGSGQLPAGIISLAEWSDVLLFLGGVLTYLATAAFATSLGKTPWLGRRAARAFAITSLVALLCLAVRGPRFPSPTSAVEHWYAIPGFVVGIPAVPWIMPCLFGVTLLRRAGDESISSL